MLPQKASPLAGGPAMFNPGKFQSTSKQFVEGFANSTMAQAGLQSAGILMGQMKQGFGSNLEKYLPLDSLKMYWKVSNHYVVNKIGLLLFPYRRPADAWARVPTNRGDDNKAPEYLPPRDDINAPDLYIPCMAMVSYVIVCAMFLGLEGAFRPDDLGMTASTVSATLFLEVLLLKVGFFFTDARVSLSLLDAFAYSGYKFIGIILAGLMGLFGRPMFWVAYVWSSTAMAVFMTRTLKLVLLPQAVLVGGLATKSHTRNYFLLLVALTQFLTMWLLSISAPTTSAFAQQPAPAAAAAAAAAAAGLGGGGGGGGGGLGSASE